MTDRLYNTYRPVTFDEIVGRSDVEIVKNIVKSGSYSYKREYLFHSDKGGVGKTATAFIFAKAINCLNPIDGNPCNNCKHCTMFDDGMYPDFVNLSGVDYNQVDKVKPIIDLARQYPRIDNGYKVIVIDEFQRMSQQAMSEFLNIFEFGNNKTIFILTTTDKKSVIQPIMTRLMPITFSSPTHSEIKDMLTLICEKEQIKYTSDNINKIAIISDNSYRNAISILEKYILGYGSISVGVDIASSFDEMVSLVSKGIKDGISTIEQQLRVLPVNTINGFPILLFNLLNYNNLDTKIITRQVYESVRYILTRNMVLDMSRLYLKHKPKTIEELILFLSIFENDSLGVNNLDDVTEDIYGKMVKKGFSAGVILSAKSKVA